MEKGHSAQLFLALLLEVLMHILYFLFPEDLMDIRCVSRELRDLATPTACETWTISKRSVILMGSDDRIADMKPFLANTKRLVLDNIERNPSNSFQVKFRCLQALE